MTTWLIFDGNFVAWRAFHSVGDLSHTGARTGTVFGFFKEVQALQNLFNTRKVIFCFDDQMSHRKALYPEYKANRVEPDDEQKKAAYEEVRKQIALLNAVYLPKIGYKNVFCQQGLEADDLIASILRWNIRRGDKVVIITADKDMYQLLSPDVEIYNLNRPLERRRYTVQDLKREWGLSPLQWRDQAVESAANAGTPYWMIIHKRDKRRIVAVMPYQLFHQLGMLGAEFNGTMGITFFCKGWHLACIRLERFLQCVEPAEIKTLLRRFRNATH